MKCYICQGEAIDRCYTCGQLFCEQHGKINCSRCEHGFAPGDRRDDHVSIDRLRAGQVRVVAAAGGGRLRARLLYGVWRTGSAALSQLRQSFLPRACRQEGLVCRLPAGATWQQRLPHYHGPFPGWPDGVGTDVQITTPQLPYFAGSPCPFLSALICRVGKHKITPGYFGKILSRAPCV